MFSFLVTRRPSISTLFPYTTLFRSYSVYQVGAVLACIVFVTLIDVLMARGAQSLGAIQWGKMPPRSQYALFILAVRSEEHTSELQSHHDLVCRLLLEKKKQTPLSQN